MNSTLLFLSSTVDSVDDAALMRIAEDWSFWSRKVPASIPRNVQLPSVLSPSLGLVIQGVRRCGKSTLLQQLMAAFEVDPRQCVFINFEDPRLLGHLSFETLQRLADAFAQRRPEGELVFFLDEIQVVRGWEKWLRAQLERPSRNRFVVTGSNASLLAGEFSSALTGRHLTVELFPFDLREAQTRGRMSLESFLERGGFPEPLTRKDGDALLRQYFIDIVERDVRERVGARSGMSVRRVVQMAFEAAGSELSLRRISGATGLAVETVAGYLEGAKDAYLLFEVPFFAFSERKRAARNNKYYPIDPGLRRVVVTRTGQDRGKGLECATHLQLRRRYGDVSYWRGKGEVDFVVRDGPRILPVQVTWSGPAARHHTALEEFYESFPTAEECLFVTADSFADIFG